MRNLKEYPITGKEIIEVLNRYSQMAAADEAVGSIDAAALEAAKFVALEVERLEKEMKILKAQSRGIDSVADDFFDKMIEQFKRSSLFERRARELEIENWKLREQIK